MKSTEIAAVGVMHPENPVEVEKGQYLSMIRAKSLNPKTNYRKSLFRMTGDSVIFVADGHTCPLEGPLHRNNKDYLMKRILNVMVGTTKKSIAEIKSRLFFKRPSRIVAFFQSGYRDQEILR